MTYQEFTSLFEPQVASIPYEKGLHLAITISKELFPDYQRFSERRAWGDPDLLTMGIELCERSLHKKINPEEIQALAAQVYAVAPDTADFGEWDGSYALNAATTVWDALNYVIDKDVSHLIVIGSYYTDTAYFKLHEMGIKHEAEIDSDPLMQAARQKLLTLSIP
jgi:uncharacterized protein DUF416